MEDRLTSLGELGQQIRQRADEFEQLLRAGNPAGKDLIAMLGAHVLLTENDLADLCTALSAEFESSQDVGEDT